MENAFIHCNISQLVILWFLITACTGSMPSNKRTIAAVPAASYVPPSAILDVNIAIPLIDVMKLRKKVWQHAITSSPAPSCPDKGNQAKNRPLEVSSPMQENDLPIERERIFLD